MTSETQRLPLSLEPNRHGHQTLTVISEALSARGEMHELEQEGYLLREGARRVLTPRLTRSGYDMHHRLDSERIYRVALVPSRDLQEPRFNQRTTANFLAYGRQFGYEQPRAGIQLVLHRLFSRRTEEQLKMLHAIFGEIHYVASLHAPIVDTRENPNLLYSRWYPEGLGLEAVGGSPLHEWHDAGLFAFWDP